jgi:hypothetical protein
MPIIPSPAANATDHEHSHSHSDLQSTPPTPPEEQKRQGQDTAAAEDSLVVWGDLRGRFIYDGDLPHVNALPVNKDRGTFDYTIDDESLIVNKDNLGLANILVFLLPGKDDELQVHPTYAESARSKVNLSLKRGQFSPHILLARTTQTIVELNEDKVAHNANIQSIRNAPRSFMIAPGAPAEYQFSNEEWSPIQIGCSVHSWMRAYILVRSNPYMAKSDTDGRFEIKNLPVGKHVFRFWHERAGYVRNARIGSFTTDAKGRLTVMIREGKNELLDARLAAKMFELED